jgi:hypothetical protein
MRLEEGHAIIVSFHRIHIVSISNSILENTFDVTKKLVKKKYRKNLQANLTTGYRAYFRLI